jgi:hypothetical protein
MEVCDFDTSTNYLQMSEGGTKMYFPPHQAPNFYTRYNPDMLGRSAFLGTDSFKPVQTPT